MPVLTFTYFMPHHISELRKLLDFGQDAVLKISDHYALIGHKNAPLHHDCHIHEILYQDIMNYPDSWIRDIYQEYLCMYGLIVTSAVFPQDIALIERKIGNTLQFAMDKVYKNDRLVVEFPVCRSAPPNTSSFPQMLYKVAQERFKLVDQHGVSIDPYQDFSYMTIMKGDDQDDNDAH